MDAGTPFRLALHRVAAGRSHFDLFLRPPGAEQLPTYEVSREGGRHLVSALGGARAEGGLAEGGVAGGGALLWRPAEGDCRVRAVPKAAHRLIYWDFEGPISGGRGRVKQLAAGFLRPGTLLPGFGSPVPAPDLLLCLWVEGEKDQG